ncbi:MAG: ornithine carbamoyltransferase, partial [bacterium]
MDLKGKNFLTLKDFDEQEISGILQFAEELKNKRNSGQTYDPMRGKMMAMIFQKPSLRTRVSFETGMYRLGGSAIYLGPSEIGLGKRESVTDIA